MWRLTVVISLAIAAAGCSSSDDGSTVPCSELWVDGADMTQVETQPCEEGGEPTIWTWAFFDCADGEELRLNDFGHWRTDDMILDTSWNSIDYSSAQLGAVCP